MTIIFAPGLLAPASMWLDARSIYVSDTHVGNPVVLALDRQIKRPFDAAWTVTIRQWANGWVSYCVARGGQFYKPDSVLPDPLLLRWWTDGQCHPLPVGKYETTTVWRVCPTTPLVPCKRVELVSNVFEVRP